jgi:hypothetical protein
VSLGPDAITVKGDASKRTKTNDPSTPLTAAGTSSASKVSRVRQDVLPDVSLGPDTITVKAKPKPITPEKIPQIPGSERKLRTPRKKLHLTSVLDITPEDEIKCDITIPSYLPPGISIRQFKENKMYSCKMSHCVWKVKGVDYFQLKSHVAFFHPTELDYNICNMCFTAYTKVGVSWHKCPVG